MQANRNSESDEIFMATDCISFLKDLFPCWYYKKDLVKYFMQHIRNGLTIDLINS